MNSTEERRIDKIGSFDCTLIRESREDRYMPHATSERKRVRPRATLSVANRMNFSLWF